MKTHKICKGQNKANGFVGCGKNVLAQSRKFGLCQSCYRDWLLESKEGQEYFDKMLLKNKVEFEKKQRAKRRQQDKKVRQSLKSISALIAEAKKPFQKWIRLRDQNLPCISCGTLSTKIWDGGHYYKAEIYTGLIFNENNCHKQCRKCNSYLGGNEINYRKGLIERYGIEYVNNLESIAGENRVKKFTRSEIEQIQNHYLDKIKNKEY